MAKNNKITQIYFQSPLFVNYTKSCLYKSGCERDNLEKLKKTFKKQKKQKIKKKKKSLHLQKLKNKLKLS